MSYAATCMYLMPLNLMEPKIINFKYKYSQYIQNGRQKVTKMFKLTQC